jgi:hypothetical protein
MGSSTLFTPVNNQQVYIYLINLIFLPVASSRRSSRLGVYAFLRLDPPLCSRVVSEGRTMANLNKFIFLNHTLG